MKVLAIDDSESVLSLIVDTLSPHKHEVETARSGQEGLQKFSKFKPNVVTLDLAMPGMDGFKVLSEIRALDKHAHVIMLTSIEHSAALQRCLKEGASGYITKPFSPRDLLNAIERMRTAGAYAPDITVFFSILSGKLEGVFKNTFQPSEISLELKDIVTIRNPNFHTASRNNQNRDHTFRPSEKDVCFISEMSGQNNGLVSSITRAYAMELLFGQAPGNKKHLSDRAVEFFHTINMKVVSELADATHLDINIRPTIYFSDPHRMKELWDETEKMWSRIEIGVFEVIYRQVAAPLDIQIWYDGELFT